MIARNLPEALEKWGFSRHEASLIAWGRKLADTTTQKALNTCKSAVRYEEVQRLYENAEADATAEKKRRKKAIVSEETDEDESESEEDNDMPPTKRAKIVDRRA